MNRSRKNRLFVERLEDRHLLAGNVSAVPDFFAGTITVTGDGSANTISVESAGAGRVQVRGFNDVNGVPTSVNGVPNGTAVFNNITQTATVRMDAGNDIVRITNLSMLRDVNLNLGSGDDLGITGRAANDATSTFGFTPSGPLFVRGQMQVQGENGNDTVFQSDAHVTGASLVNLGVGNDLLQMQRPANSGENVEVGGTLTLRGDVGNDTMNLTGVVARSNMLVEDFNNRLSLIASSMDVFGSLTVRSGNDIDTLNISATNVRNTLTFNSGEGNDTVTFNGIAPNMAVLLGAGNDTFNINGASFTNINADGGDGSDVFEIRGAVGRSATFNGNTGTDTFRVSISQPNSIQQLTKISIEQNQTTS